MLLFSFDQFQISRFTWDVIDANSYLLTEDGHGLLIDAIDSLELLEALSTLEDVSIILTHCHFDHICGLNQIRETVPNTTVYASRLCSENIGIKTKNLSSTANAFIAFYIANKQKHQQETGCAEAARNITPFVCAPADRPFDGETTMNWQEHTLKLLQCGGHTKDSLIAVMDGRYMFSGDTLLSIPTVTRFPSGSTTTFWEETVPQLKSMSVELVLPGHGEPGQLGDMLAINQVPERYQKA